jgi:hypothetical protein
MGYTSAQTGPYTDTHNRKNGPSVWDTLAHRRDHLQTQHNSGDEDLFAELRKANGQWSRVLRTVIDVFQVSVLLDIDADPPAVQEYHQDRDVLRTRQRKVALTVRLPEPVYRKICGDDLGFEVFTAVL